MESLKKALREFAGKHATARHIAFQDWAVFVEGVFVGIWDARRELWVA